MKLDREATESDAGKLTVRHNLVVTNCQISVATPKTKGSQRTITLDVQTVAALKAHRVRQVAERLAWGDIGHVFVRENGEWIHPERLTRRFDAFVRSAGLPRITLHGLRHSIVSAQLAAGFRSTWFPSVPGTPA